MSRLLEMVEHVCGSHARTSVFEPLVADWQRELAAAASMRARLRILLTGSIAFSTSFVSCVLTGGVEMPRATIFTATAVLFVSTLLLVAIQIGLNAAALNNDLPFEMRFWMALPMILPLAIPMAMLPIMMVVRSTGHVSGGAAVMLIGTCAVLTYMTAGLLTPLLRGDVRDDLYEEVERRIAASEREGRVFYPTTAARQAQPLTPEDRAVARERWKLDPHYLESQDRLTRPRWGRSSVMVAGLALAMGVFGWGLGGLRRRDMVHAGAWWTLAWFALVILDGRFLYPGNGITTYIGRPPDWMPLAVFAASAFVLLIRERGRFISPQSP